jgi:hypothetical protein
MDPPAEQPTTANHPNSTPTDHWETAEANAWPVHPEQSEAEEEAPSTHTIDAYDGHSEEPISVSGVAQCF